MIESSPSSIISLSSQEPTVIIFLLIPGDVILCCCIPSLPAAEQITRPLSQSDSTAWTSCGFSFCFLTEPTEIFTICIPRRFPFYFKPANAFQHSRQPSFSVSIENTYRHNERLRCNSLNMTSRKRAVTCDNACNMGRRKWCDRSYFTKCLLGEAPVFFLLYKKEHFL